MKQKILNIIDEYCQVRKNLGKYPYVISRSSLTCELKNNGLNVRESIGILNELINEGKLFTFEAINEPMYYTEKYKL